MNTYKFKSAAFLLTLSILLGTSSAQAQTCACPVVYSNGSIEQPAFGGSYVQTNESNVPGWNTTAPDNKIEIWKSGFNGVPAAHGNQFVEINATTAATLYQDLCLDPGTIITWSIYHRGRNGVDVASIGFGTNVSSLVPVQTLTDGKSWGFYSGSYTVPAGQTTTVVGITALSSVGPDNSFGNFIDHLSISVTFDPCDSDGDGIADADEDYPNDPSRAFNNYFPATGFGTLMYEDLWPYKGDYDFNDIVVDYQFNTVTNASNAIVETFADFKLRASGASYDNGFGFQLANNLILAADMSVSGSILNNGIVSTGANGMEINQNKPTIMVFDNAFDLLPYPGSGTGVNTEEGVAPVPQADINLLITYKPNTYSLSDLNIGQFNPFIFVDADRSREVHLPNFAPTALADLSLFGTGEDDSNVAGGRTYKTDDNLPWALNVIESIPYPKERIDITECYPFFDDWAQSNGVQNTDWFQNAPGYRVGTKLYP